MPEVDVLRSSWPCMLEKEENGTFSLRLGLRYVRGLRQGSAAELVAAREMRSFTSIEELARRVPSLTRADLTTLAEVGALSSIGVGIHRRDALWQVERAGRRPGALLAALDRDVEVVSPLRPMEPQERMVAGYASTGVTVGRHPMAHCREQLRTMRVVRAEILRCCDMVLKLASRGCVIARQPSGYCPRIHLSFHRRRNRHRQRHRRS
jgi:error-prone DNA polymerase